MHQVELAVLLLYGLTIPIYDVFILLRLIAVLLHLVCFAAVLALIHF